jgi:hypothetical protein
MHRRVTEVAVDDIVVIVRILVVASSAENEIRLDMAVLSNEIRVLPPNRLELPAVSLHVSNLQETTLGALIFIKPSLFLTSISTSFKVQSCILTYPRIKNKTM